MENIKQNLPTETSDNEPLLKSTDIKKGTFNETSIKETINSSETNS